jgi:CRP/FNR family transcriptional regulator
VASFGETLDDERAQQANDAWFGPAQRYPPAVELFRQGQLLQEVFSLDTGFVKLTRVTSDGREMIVDLVFAATWIGTAAVLMDSPAPVSAVTCTELWARRAPASAFRQRLQEDAQFSSEIQRVHAREWCHHTDWIAQLASSNSRQRLLGVLRDFIAVLGLSNSQTLIKFHMPLHHWEVASLIAVTPEHLSRLLNEVQAEGILQRHKRWITIPDLEHFKRVCESSGIEIAPRAERGPPST